ncbi:MAG: hypothetical protein L0Y72_12605 [Gemmataceae bacterium]|nr:hypothetical protein [Gemmataceae bacterium]MCI0739879.1 hypothetical protein [Gemmataceae bacterium]
MKLTTAELEILSAWAKEESVPECYERPAHRLQLAHGVTGAFFIDFIKAWTETEGKKDKALVQAANNLEPSWPWKSTQEFIARLEETTKAKASRGARAGPYDQQSNRRSRQLRPLLDDAD